MTNPLVSVIIATHNRAELLPEAVESILSQSLQDFEIIIVDDCSADNTPDVIRGLERRDPRTRSIRSEENIGPGAARNLGVNLATGEFIAIMDDDDISMPNRLERQILEFENNPDSMLVFSSVAWVDDDLQVVNNFPGIVFRGEFPLEPKDVFHLLYLESNKVPNTSLLVRKYVCEQAQYPPFPWIGEDWYFFMLLSALGTRFSAISEPLVLQRRGVNRQGLMNTSRNKRFTWERQVLSMTRTWLAREKIHDFDHLHKRALSNQILRESHHYNVSKGLRYLIQASIIDPGNPKIHQELNRFAKLISNKVKKVFSKV